MSFHNGIVIGVDDTDHVAFYCPDCDVAMKVFRVFTQRINVSDKGDKDKCTWVYLRCRNCKGEGQRKFYWTIEDGMYCDDKTSTTPSAALDIMSLGPFPP